MTRRSITATLAITLLALAVSPRSLSADEKKARVLFITQSKGFRHGPVNRKKGELASSEVAMTQLGKDTGLFEIDCSQNTAEAFTVENLEKYDIVMFYTTGVLPISNEARDYFMNDWLKKKGHGWIGFHSATDTYRTKNPEHKWYWELAGGSFQGHPWGSGNTVTISVHDTSHPAMKAYGGAEFKFKDEIYQYYNWVPENVRVLMSLNMAKCNPKKPYL